MMYDFAECPKGSYGQNCTKTCVYPKYGWLCYQTCDCADFQYCNLVDGCSNGIFARVFILIS